MCFGNPEGHLEAAVVEDMAKDGASKLRVHTSSFLIT